MCNGFGLIVGKTLELYFSEPRNDGNCSHSDILSCLGWKDNDNLFIRQFVRVQFPDWTKSSFEFDEEGTLPAWVEENRQEIIDKCVKTLERIAPAWDEYKKVCAPAWNEYKKVCAPALDEYEKVRDAAWDEYEKVHAPAWDELIVKLSSIPGYRIRSRK